MGGRIRGDVRSEEARCIETIIRQSSKQSSDRPAMTYGSAYWAVEKKDESKLNSAEMRMLRWTRGKTCWITSEMKT